MKNRKTLGYHFLSRDFHILPPCRISILIFQKKTKHEKQKTEGLCEAQGEGSTHESESNRQQRIGISIERDKYERYKLGRLLLST